MIAQIKQKDAEYEFRNGDIVIYLSINFETSLYTLIKEGDEPLEHSFVSADPNHTGRVIELMAAATEYAIEILAGNGKTWEGVTITTNIEVSAVEKNVVQFQPRDEYLGDTQ